MFEDPVNAGGCTALSGAGISAEQKMPQILGTIHNFTVNYMGWIPFGFLFVCKLKNAKNGISENTDLITCSLLF